jgi:crossover junction endodeoxyribonuclease RuvC
VVYRGRACPSNAAVNSSPALSLDLAPAASTARAPSVLALDLSLTATGWAKSDGSSVVSSGVLRTPEELDGMERIKWILDSVWNLTEGAHFTVIEGYAFDRPNQAHQIGELGGVVRFTLWEGGRPFVLIAPSSMKMFATGKGNASKDEVLACAIRKLDYLGFSKDEADALFLLDMARAHYDGRTLTAKQTQALAKIQWPLLTTANT